MKTAIVHDWLVSYRGGEKVLEAIAQLYPDAPIFTLFFERKKISPYLSTRNIRYPRRLNFLRPLRKLLLPFLPTAVEQIDLSAYDLIISTSSCVAKGVIPAPHALHICYLHSPMRYIWDQKNQYFGRLLNVPAIGFFIELILTRLRIWDSTSSTRCDKFIVNSNFVGQRVKKYYGRESFVLHPPIDFDFFAKNPLQSKEDYFVAAGAFVPYKRFDLAIEACEKLGKRLLLVGSGPMLAKFKKMAGNMTEIIINPEDEQLRTILAKAQALIFPGVEDFGLLAIEAMACGTPVIALKRGGALDFIKEGENGLFFSSPEITSLQDIISKFTSKQFDSEKIRKFAENFKKSKFQEDFLHRVQGAIKSE